jgi:8-oxo-dGTP diphosphatase
MELPQRKVQTSVTNFLHCENEYLFLKRHPSKPIDPGKLNGIGGKVEPGEDYGTAAIRETFEETGYVISEKDLQLAGIVRLEGGYGDDWIMSFFTIAVTDKTIPLGTETADGEFFWIPANKVLTSGYELVDDLYYCFEDVTRGTHIFFMSATVGKDLKIKHTRITRLPRTKAQT